MTTINDIADLARILREQPEWADALRSILLGQELLAMPVRLAELAERFDQFVQLTQETHRQDVERFDQFLRLTQETHRQVNERLALLEASTKQLEANTEQLNDKAGRLEARFDRMEGRFSNFEGSEYERKVLNRVVLSSVQRFGFVRPRLAFSNHFQPTAEFDSLMARARNNGLLTPEEVDDLINVDMIVSASNNRHLLAEASITLGTIDVDRVKRRASIWAAATGGEAIPAVVTAHAETIQAAYADAQEVAIFNIAYP